MSTATRTSARRSAGGADGLNRAMINLLPYARLKEECEKRGLPTDGNKQALSERLEDSLDGIYVHPSTTANATGISPSTSRTPSSSTTPKSRNNSAKAPPNKRTPRRRSSVGEEDASKHSASPPKKKARRNSSKKEETESRECSHPPKEENEVIEEDFSVTIVAAPAEPQFDSDDDLPLISGPKEDAVPAEAVAAEDGREEKDKKKKNKRKIKEEEDIETGAVLPKGDSEWVPPEESEKRTRRDSTRRSRRNTLDDKQEDDDDREETSSTSMPILDPEIYDQEGPVEVDGRKQTEPKLRNGLDVKSTSGDTVKKMRKDSSSSSSLDRPRPISNATSAVKERRESTASSPIVRPPKEKPATLRFAEIMAQRKKEAEAAAAAAAATAVATNGVNSAPDAQSAAESSTVVKKEEVETSGDESPLSTSDKSKMDLPARRISVSGVTGSPSASDTSSKGGFSMIARKNAPTRQSAVGGASDLLGDLLGKQQVLLEKKVTSSAEAEAEKLRIVSQIKQRAPDLRIREGTVKEEKERLQKEKEEREKMKEERERKEREQKIIVISAPNRPIPPPPPPPPKKAEDSLISPKEDAVEKEIKKEEEAYSIKESPKSSDAANDGEYEPYTPGPSMPPLDRSILIAHRRERQERAERLRREEWKQDHGIMAPEAPTSFQDPFLLRLSDKLKKIKQMRDPSPIPDEIRECMEDMLKKVEAKVEKEMKWERKTKRKTEYQEEKEKEEAKKRAEIMRDPRALLAKATNILQSMQGGSTEEDGGSADSPADAANALHISQHVAEPGTYEENTEDRALPEFHGEPVPSDDDEALFLEAAGLPKKDKKPKHPVIEEEAPPSHEHILMDYYNACLHIKSANDKPWLIEPDNENGLALMWGGVRANYGYVLPWREEKKCLAFQIKVLENQSIRHLPFNEQEPYDVRIGFSLRQSGNILGESSLSWGFSTTGKKCTNNIFREWGHPIEIGDVVSAVLDFSAKSISFYKNGEDMGVAFKDIVLPSEDDAIFAHVCVKNCKVAVNLGSFPEVEGGWGEDELAPYRQPDWLFPTEIERNRFEMSRLPPNEKASCTLLMMVGLPGVGKTTFVRQYIRDHPLEKWDVINAEGVMAAMKVNGVPRARAHTGRWDMVLGLVAKALQKLVLLAARRRRNYIVDLSNVNRDARKRRLMHFKDFTKKCIVIVPDETEMVNRQMMQARQEGSSHVPAEAILEMKAVFTFPTEEAEGFDEVYLVEPEMDRIAEAIQIIQKFNDEGKPWYQKRYRGRGSRRGGRGGGYMGGGGGGPPGGGERRGSDYARPLSVSTAASNNGSGPPTNVVDGGRGRGSPGGWGMPVDSPSTSVQFSWAARKAGN